MLILLAPLMLGLAALVAATSSGGALYGHTRVGYNNRPFSCMKFRTMDANGDQILIDHLARNPLARIEWEETQKLKDDPRVTRVGGVLRKLSLDELPQLINVVKGEMSLVGPRPVKADELLRYGRSQRHYLSARPGITGLWQVSGRNSTSYGRRVAFDRKYVTKRNDLTDVIILARTLPAAMRSSETS
ncbi:Undecaprenyl phosphate N,N'-diacetylbacillosamine 1-phosphate transferase [Rhodobacteraceae bacterium THAF1]|uniref:sugar transferase n=1 Tax=Palleronia sp. THAF1 TaxID=2587842 RepID=UPI000F3F16CF|nr:sugar transferase [Palleronia sp. THAF1]QFU10366.1 Undecaprenyl phosphate N,N'-diacetylbacillosamine 1-phosphate transferase [Palleronia sp. THAF1]VDC31485.1 Undecaprenyl phosphate N,N'-diacetylbacillosamine 1-phosphate transferase [Rhodobacteraceae bacterium THAF1]